MTWTYTYVRFIWRNLEENTERVERVFALFYRVHALTAQTAGTTGNRTQSTTVGSVPHTGLPFLRGMWVPSSVRETVTGPSLKRTGVGGCKREPSLSVLIAAGALN